MVVHYPSIELFELLNLVLTLLIASVTVRVGQQSLNRCAFFLNLSD